MKRDYSPILKRTGKREVAFLLLAALLGIWTKIFFFTPPELVESYRGVLAEINYPTLTFVAIAFGLQVWQQRVAQRSADQGNPPPEEQP